MKIPYVCLQCSRQIIRPNGQLRNTSFVSFGRVAQEKTDIHPKPQKTRVDDDDGKRSHTRGKRRQSFAQQYREQRKPTGVDKVLETLFASSSAQQDVGHLSRYSRTPKELRSERQSERQSERLARESSIEHRLHELHNQLKRGTSKFEYIWASCRQLLSEGKWFTDEDSGAEATQNISHDVFREILLAMCSKQRIVVHKDVVTPAVVIDIYMKHGAMGYWWHSVIWSHLKQLLELEYEVVKSSSGSESHSRIRMISQSLHEIWALFLKQFEFYNGAGAALHYGRPQEEMGPRRRARQSVSKEFLELLREHHPTMHVETMIAAAIMSHDSINRNQFPCPPMVGSFFRALRHHGEADPQITKIALSDAGLRSGIIQKVLGDKVTSSTGIDWGASSLDDRLEDIWMTRLKSDAKHTISLWESFLTYLRNDDRNDQDTSSRIFARFLFVFWALHRQDRAIEVWNYMINSGSTPGQIHWNAMLKGCVTARDAMSLQQIWANMTESAFRPDLGTWVTYVHGLIRLGKWQDGLQALQTLGRVWKDSPPTIIPNANTTRKSLYDVSPSMAPVKAAISALIDVQKPEVIPSVIAWAESLKLQFDTETFNILLKSAASTNTYTQVQAHLAQMARHNCAPDLVTFTAILDGVVSNEDSQFQTLSPERQESTITSMLDDMVKNGITPKVRTYATLIERLIGDKNVPNQPKSVEDRKVSAARTILSHMQKQGMFPSPQIYTMLVNHYFACTPPDLAAINSLWNFICQGRQVDRLDQIFYDTIIQGYANIDETEKALQFLQRMPKEGKSPGWWVLYRLLAAFDRAGEWQLCKDLMNDVEDPQGLLKYGQGFLGGKHEFYRLVDELRAKGLDIGGEDQV